MAGRPITIALGERAESSMGVTTNQKARTYMEIIVVGGS